MYLQNWTRPLPCTVFVLLLLACLVKISYSQMTFHTEDENQQKISFKAPELNEEEEKSPFFTKAMKCDGCRAVVYQIHTAFEKRHKNFVKRSQYRMEESELLDLLEQTCDDPKTFQDYGITKDQRDESLNRLKGPGLYKGFGLSHMGGKTPFRLMELCGMLLDLEESQIYESWLQNGKAIEGLQTFMCEQTLYCQPNYNVPNLDEL